MTKSTTLVTEIPSAKKKKRSKDVATALVGKDLGTAETTLNGLTHGRTLGQERWKTSKRELPVDAAHFNVPLSSSEKRRRRERKERFEESARKGHESSSQQHVGPLYKPLSASRTLTRSDPKAPSASSGPLVGENSNLEKPYLRLTTFPRKEDVRPLKVLIKSLAHIKFRYVQDEDFNWANEQLKSVRQDMTVQRIRNRFVLDVYETHARILLEHGDLDEFNQCQTMIRSLTEGMASDEERAKDELEYGFDDLATVHSPDDEIALDAPLVQASESEDEFRGYAILYALVRNSSIELKTELARAKSSRNGVSCPATSSYFHAVSVVRAVDDNDYHTFFRLYESAPHMSAYLMDFLVKRVRDRAYERIIASYRPNVNVEYVRECLRFRDLDETRRFLRQGGAVFVAEETTGPPFWVDCKASAGRR